MSPIETPKPDLAIVQWPCRHRASPVCSACHRELFLKAERLNDENHELRERVAQLELILAPLTRSSKNL